jgi:hypothetical protein
MTYLSETEAIPRKHNLLANPASNRGDLQMPYRTLERARPLRRRDRVDASNESAPSLHSLHRLA